MNFMPAFIRRRIEHRPNLVNIVHNTGWLFFDNILRMGIGLIVGVWVARYLGPGQYGLLSYAIAFVGLFSTIATLGLKDIVVRDIVRYPSSKEKTLGTAALLQIFCGLLVYSLILASIFWLRPDDALAITLVAILGSITLFSATEVAVYWFESQVLSKYIVWVQNGVFLVFAVIKIAFILQNASLIAFAWTLMGEALIVAGFMIMLLSLQGPALKRLEVSASRAKTLLTDSWPLLLSSIAIVIYMKIDQIMLGQMVGNEEVGVYSAAVRISEVWYFVPMAIVASVFPAILEAKKRCEEEYYQRLQHLYDLMVWLSICIALPMTFLSTPVVILLFGDTYQSAGSVLAVHIWAAVFVSLGIASGKWFLAEDRQILSLQRTVLGACANVVLNIMLIPEYGVMGAAWATVIAYAIAAMLSDFVQNETRKMFLMKANAFNISAVVSRYIHLRN